MKREVKYFLRAVDCLPNHIIRKINFTPTCWVWEGEQSPNGYGRCWYRGIRQAAHRVLYLIAAQKPIEGWQVDHKCCNRQCVNPAHLQHVTPKKNARLREERNQ